jgi:uncharacterized membrane protein (TIGR02234 family)
VLGSVVAGGLALSAGGQAWATVVVERREPLPPVSGVLEGVDAAPLVPAAGLVLLAAAVVLLAVRGVARVVVGLLVGGAGGVLAWSALRTLIGGPDPAAAELPAIVGSSLSGVSTELSPAWPLLAALAGVLAIAVGGLVVLRGRAWPGLGSRYERTAAAPRSAPVPRTDEERAQLAWNALDRGEDPTR